MGAIAPPGATTSASEMLVERLLDPPAPGNALYTYEGGEYRPHTWSECGDLARRAATHLREAGAEPGDVVACVFDNTLASAVLPLAAWLVGSRVASLPPRPRGVTREQHVDKLVEICADCDAKVVAAPTPFDEDLRAAPDLTAHALSLDRLTSAALPFDSSAVEALDSGLFIQYSSGSTGDPRGCVLAAEGIVAQLDMLVDRVGLTTDDRFVSWIPLSHDMGLFGGLLASWWSGMTVWLGTTTRFLLSAGTWLNDCAQVGATLTVSPNFGVALAARSAQRRLPPALSLRKWIVASDYISNHTLRSAVESLGPAGIREETFMPGYGLAEATLCVTMVESGIAPPVAPVPGDPGQVAVSSGTPLPGNSVRIDGDEEIGEIVVRSPSLALGYLGRPDVARERFRDGELWTRDLGFVRDGHLYVVGRLDDRLSVAGRTVHTKQVEAALEAEQEIRGNSCVLTEATVGGVRRVVLLAEPRRSAGDSRSLAATLGKATYERIGVRVDDCLLLRPGALPMTASGKKQRVLACRLAERLLAGEGTDEGHSVVHLT
ncbi:MAG: AMP-binding protein [Gaiellaceae bacterium]